MSGSISPERWALIEPIVDRALDRDPGEWPVLLEEACGGDRELHRVVASLLARHGEMPGFLDPFPDPAPESLEGRRLGRYRLVRELARGGMGWVFLAERADGEFERRVALKLLRPSLNEGDAARRFEVERRILAGLDHSGIARLIDAGRTAEGRPYLVTEYVAGEPIDRFCELADASLDARLGLFRQVAEAVDHAHRNLLIHRDLKPSNVLVTPEGRAKLLDFGIAKPLDRAFGSGHHQVDAEDGAGDAARSPRLKAPETRPDRRWMTPGYAAPEQITGGALTTATDVYQLGGLLYELLCDRRPFDGDHGSLHELERAVLSVDPAPPSAVALRGKEAREFRGDLDAIVLKALRKEPEARYPTARALLDDLDLMARGRPVRARRGTIAYRTRRFIRRHRLESVAGTATLVALLLGAGLAAWQADEARQDRDRAEAARLEAERALDRGREVTSLLLDLFQATDPWGTGATDPAAARELLSLGVARVDALDGQPRVQAAYLDALAAAHLRSGALDEAESLARGALALRHGAAGPDPPGTAESLNGLALVLKGRGRFAEAERLHREALGLQMRHLGDAHPEVAATLSLLASRLPGDRLAEAEALRRRALEIRRDVFGTDHPLVAASLMSLGRTKRSRGRPVDAEADYREALAIRRRVFGPDHPDVAESMVFLADLLKEFYDDDEAAEPLYRRALAIQEGALGGRHPARIHALGNLSRLLSDRGDRSGAEALLRESLDLRRAAFGPEHRQVAEGLGHLGDELLRQGRLAEAEQLHRESLAQWERLAGEHHWAVSGALVGLGRVLVELERYDEAERHYHRAVEIRQEAMGEEHERLGPIFGTLARLHARRGSFEQAEALYLRGLALLREQRSQLHPDTRRLHAGLAELYDAWDRPGAAGTHRRLAAAAGAR